MIPRLPKGFTHPMPVGKGSFSSVYRVRQAALDRWVAIKVLDEKSPERRRELLKEAQRQAQLRVAGIPAIYDAFEWRGQVCLVMQWVRGVTLERALERGVPPAARGGLAAAAVAALAGLHRLGYAHRDLKPANILVSPEDGLYLVDFGLAKRPGDGNETVAGAVMGTPAYMAPELWRSDSPVDPMRADLFALGRILRRLGPGPEWSGLEASLLAEDPSSRPASAVEVWTRHESLLASPSQPDWRALAGAATAEELAGRLLTAAKELLFAGRLEEAYWLGVECLESDPDSAEALSFMDRIPDASRRQARIRRLWKATLAAGFALAVTGAFLAGRRTQPPARVLAPSAEPREAFLLPDRDGEPAPAGAGPLVLREIAGRGGLSGRLTVLSDGCRNMLLDGKAADAAALRAGTAIRAGDHVLACAEGTSARRERFTLLPFQDKVIRLGVSAPGDGA